MNRKNIMSKKKRSMSSRLAATYMILITLVIGCAAVAFYKFYEYDIYSEGVKNVRQQSASSIAQIDACLTSMEQATVDVLSDNTFIDTWMQARESGSEEDALAVRRILTKSYSNKSNIRRISVYSEDGMWFSTGKVTVTKDQVLDRIRMIQKNYNMSVFNSRAYIPPHTDFWNEELGTSVIAEVKPIKDKNTKIIGYIEVQQNTMYMERICSLTWNGEPIDVMIFETESDELFYLNKLHTPENLAFAEAVKERTLSALYYDEDDEAIYSCAYSNVSPCKMVLVMEKKFFTKSARNILYGIPVIALLLILVTAFYSYWMTRIIMRPINLLVKRMEKTELYNFDKKLEISSTDRETEILVNAFEEMAHRLQESMKQRKRLENLQTKALFSALQSTMGPHFLYNSLGGIANLCERGEDEEAANACYSLTEILRYASNYEDSEVTIRDEIENVHDYMSIMKSRYRQRIAFELYADKEAEGILIPKLTLQPLIENAIRYSLLENETVFVKIYIIILGNNLIIEVKDNGCGIEAEKIREIRQKIRDFHDKMEMESHNVKFGGLGLVGTLIRLSIYYGDCFRFEVQNQNDEGGTSIQLITDITKYR